MKGSWPEWDRFGRAVREGDLVALRYIEHDQERAFCGILDARAPGHVREYSIPDSAFEAWLNDKASPRWAGMLLLERDGKAIPAPSRAKVARLPLRAYGALRAVKALRGVPPIGDTPVLYAIGEWMRIEAEYAPWPERICDVVQGLGGSIEYSQLDDLWLETMFGADYSEGRPLADRLLRRFRKPG